MNSQRDKPAQTTAGETKRKVWPWIVGAIVVVGFIVFILFMRFPVEIQAIPNEMKNLVKNSNVPDNCNKLTEANATNHEAYIDRVRRCSRRTNVDLTVNRSFGSQESSSLRHNRSALV